MRTVFYRKPVELTIYIVAALIGIGLVMVYSARVVGPGSIDMNFSHIYKHLISIVFGTCVLIFMSKVDYHYFEKYKYILLGAGLLGLVLVMVPGVGAKVNGARRWVRFGDSFGFQPSEIAKISLLVFISAYIVKNSERMHEIIRGVMIPIGIIVPFLGLLLLEPDFGTAVFMAITSITLLIIGGTRVICIIFIMMAGIPYIHELLFEVAYRKDRLLIFLDPWKDPNNSGYQIIQSLIALGSGGLFGKGLGASRQKLNFLPESGSDFILTIVGEEIGFLGIVTIIVLFGLLVWNGIRICRVAPDLFGFLMAFGITFMIGLQAAINIAVVSALVPTKGIPLPFISEGGSSLFMFMLTIGILINIGKQGLNKIKD